MRNYTETASEKTHLDEKISEAKAAKLLSCNPSYLARLRIRKVAPDHKMVGGEAFYTRREIMRWLKTNKKKK